MILSLSGSDPRLVGSQYFRDRRDSWDSLPYARVTKVTCPVDVDLSPAERDAVEHLERTQGLAGQGWFDVAYDAR